MHQFKVFLGGLFLIFGLTGAAWATPMGFTTNVDIDFGTSIFYEHTATFTSNNVLNNSGFRTWEHALPVEFSVPPDVVLSATLVITSQRASGQDDVVSIIDFGNLANTDGNFWLNATGNSPVSTTFDLEDLGLFSAGWEMGLPLRLRLDFVQGGNENSQSLTMVNSIFTLNYENAAAGGGLDPIPEPSTLILLGGGLLGLVVARMRRK